MSKTLLVVAITACANNVLLASAAASPTVTWQFQGYGDAGCQNEIISERGDSPRDCANTPTRLQSYRFSSAVNPETGDTFSVRLYDDPDSCVILSVIDDKRDGACNSAPFGGFNVFAFYE